MLRLPYLLAGLSVLSLLISCVPKAVAERNSEATMTELELCSLKIDLSAFDLISSSSDEMTANYRIALRSPLRELSSEVRKQLEANGWEFMGTAKASRTDNTYSARYTCAERATSLQVSIKPVGRSSIYVVRLALE